MRPPAWQRACVTAACTYEIVALWHPKVPTVTHLCHRYPLAARIFETVLSDHFEVKA